jgi:hypothetical protein
VRRTDVQLRARYPQLTTRIFQIGQFAYRIVFDGRVLNAAQIRAEFEKSIRPVTLQIDLSNNVPPSFLREIPPISDHELAHGFAGLPLNRDDLSTIIAGKFPKLPELVAVGPAIAPGQKLTFARELSDQEKSLVQKFFDDYEPGWPITFAYSLDTPKPLLHAKIPDEILRIRSSRSRPKSPQFVQEDEAFWFDHVDNIFEGNVHSSNILDFQDAGMACYVDASAFRQIDLRQALICYDTIFLSPPLAEPGIRSFWETQAVSRDGVLELVAAGRLRFVLRQPEERTDPDFLAAAYQIDPAAIIGRRKAAALVAADLIQTADEYRFNQEDIVPHISELARLLSPVMQAPEAEVIQLLLWPNSARRSCLLPLTSNGLMSLGSFGPGRLLGEQLQRITGRDVQLEALVTTDGVHIAHTLNATLIPPLEDMEGWLWPRRAIGDRLNFYRSFNKRIAATWAASERRREEGVRVLPPIPLFEFTRHARLADLIAVTSHSSTRRKGRGLVSRLSDLPEEERQVEMDRLSQELFEHGARKERRHLVFDTLDNAKEVGLAFADVTLFPVRSAWGLVKIILAAGRKIPAIDNFIDDLERDLVPRRFQNDDIDFLSKIERVAELRDQPAGTVEAA